MSIRIYNSLTGKKEIFEPVKAPKVNIYTCGVTVYDQCHIGHARSLYIFDLIRRYLEYQGFKVKFVRNITDIDDKIINRANELKKGWRELTKEFIKSYYEDLKDLGIKKGDFEPRAAENIKEMIAYVKELIDKGYAYESQGDVYFDVRKFSGYGRLSGQSIDQMRSGARIDPAESKKDALDFALWKASKEGEPFWKSPWGEGRPGWHIECSVMAQKFLKTDTLDIHAGGRDLIFPHHENETAQAEARTGRPFAKYWMHHGLLTIEGRKMAKSAGNFVAIKDVLDKYPADVLKFFYLQAHYSKPIDFSWEKMEETKKAYERIIILLDKLEKNYGVSKAPSGRSAAGGFKDKFIEYMDDDFNTPRALSVLFDMMNKCNAELDGSSEHKEQTLRDALYAIKEIGRVLGFSFSEEQPLQISESEIEELIAKRLDYKKQKNFERSDLIRRELEKKGVILEDAAGGRTTWRKKLYVPHSVRIAGTVPVEK